ncbi:hypothetical protein GGR53DRAFT_490515 [Hypoxylon sp. FL1150]|nr:hypothetical protein GGR53DRAFT_490515 [Hypoxylon sp. FL1150]
MAAPRSCDIRPHFQMLTNITYLVAGMVFWNFRKSEKAYRIDKKPQIESSRNFLKVLVDPPEPSVDIIAVHGLNPLDKQLHAEATWTAGEKLWLRDFLPKQVPHARILLFGYNSNVALQASTAGVTEQAENLLNQVETVRSTDPNRPLMFICHSLGGIIVKRALVHSNNDKTYNAIRQATFGIAFFGTPHKGGNHADVGDVAAKIARAILGSPSNNFMSALKGSSAMNDTTRDFRQLLEEFQFLTFYETRPLDYFGIIVSQDSAILGLPGTREKQIPLDADHRQICKFSSEEDPRYRQVADNISKMVSDACSPQTCSSPGEPSSDEDEYHFDEEKSSYDGNESNILGLLNATVQVGNGNWSTTKGDKNETQQFGNRNRSVQNGTGNQTIQLATDSELWRFMEMILLGIRYLFSITKSLGRR